MIAVRVPLGTIALFLIALHAAPSAAEEKRRQIEEIIVTAQKKEQAITDVPLAISVIDDDFIAQEGLVDLQDVAIFSPNTAVRSSRGAAASIRGFTTSSLNKAFDQSVALVIDGVPYNRVPYLELGLFDVERVEILRGPQGHLIGKSASAGAIQVITKRPTDEFTGYLDVQLGELSRRRFEGAIGGPLIKDLVNLRIGALSDEENGFIRNTFARVDRSVPKRWRDKDIQGGRLKLEFPDLFESRVGLSAEHFEVRFNSTGPEIKSLTNGVAGFFRDLDPGLDSRFGNERTSMDGPDDQRDEITTLRGDWSRELFGWGLDLFATHSVLRSRLDVDFDFLPAPILHVPSRDDNPQTTVELRGVSPTFAGFFGLGDLFGLSLGTTDVTAGLFWQKRELVDDRTTLNVDAARLLGAVAANELDHTPDTGAPPPLGIGAGDIPPLIESSTMFFAQNANTFAAFGNVEWQFLPEWTLVTGLRLSFEEKKAVWKRVFTSPTHVIFTQSLNWREFEMRDERTEFDFVPKVALGWKPWEGASIFASWTKGVKGGGFNDTASGPSELERTFDRERVEQWEIDSRWTLLDDTLSVGLTLFRMDLRDFQLITTRPQDIVQIVENIGLLRAQGVELESLWLPTDWLRVLGTLAYSDSHYEEFPFGACPLSFPDTDGDGDPRCDYAGVPFAPNWSLGVTPAVTFALDTIPVVRSLATSFGDVALESSVTTQWIDVRRNPQLAIDIRNREESLFIVGGRIGFASAEQGWSITLQGENLTDELINAATLEISGLADNFVGVPEPGRVLFLQFRYAF